MSPDAALSPRRATHFLLLRQEKVSKEKATLVPASLRFATGNLRCSAQPGSRANSPTAQTSTSPFPSGLPLLGAFTRVLGMGRIQDRELCCRLNSHYYFDSCSRKIYLGSRLETPKKPGLWVVKTAFDGAVRRASRMVLRIGSQFRCEAKRSTRRATIFR